MFSEFSERCGKVMFLSKSDADRQVVEREADRGDWFGKSYQCHICKKWHITTLKNNENVDSWSDEMLSVDNSVRDSWGNMSQSLSSSMDAESLEKLKHLFD